MLWLNLLESLLPMPGMRRASSSFGSQAANITDSSSHLSNQTNLLITGIALMIASSVLTLLQSQGIAAWRYIWQAESEVVVDSDDESYALLAEYLASNNSNVTPVFTILEDLINRMKTVMSKLRSIFQTQPQLKSHFTSHEPTAKSVVARTAYETKDSKTPTIFYVPNDGQYLIKFNGADIYFTISTSENKNDANPARNSEFTFRGPNYNSNNTQISPGTSKQTITLRTYHSMSSSGFRSIQALLQTAVEAFHSKQRGKTSVFVFQPSTRSGWKRFSQKPARHLDTIILAPEIKDQLLDDVHGFLKSEAWYRNLGIPFRRGYLLHGPPGTGKSSFIFALAGNIGMDVCLVNLGAPEMNDSILANALSDSPKNSVLVFEDIDVAMGRKEAPVVPPVQEEGEERRRGPPGKFRGGMTMTSSETSNVTLSGLLNALDGLIAQEGRIVFMTTNNIGTLPAALMRPGRVDRRFLFHYATVDVAVRLFVRFYGDVLGEEEASSIGRKVADQLGVKTGQFGIAQLQGFYSRHRSDPRKILSHVDEFLLELEQQKKEEQK